MTDFLVVNHGSVWTFEPLTDAAKAFAAEAFDDSVMFGNAYVAEHRYAPPIVADLIEQGFVVKGE